MSIFGRMGNHPNLVGLGALGAGVGLPVALSRAHTVDTEESTHLFRAVPEPGQNQRAEETMDDVDYSELPRVPHSYLKLLGGDETYNGGNYVIYYGSEACVHCTGFLFGDQTISDGSLYSRKNRMSDGTFMKAFASTREDKDLSHLGIKFLMYEDVPDVGAGGDEYWTLPWTTWPEDDVPRGRKKGEYVRHDPSARDFRRMFEAAQNRFGERVSGTPTVIVYREGKPVVFNQDPLPGMKARKQDEAMSNDIQLKEFIKHYFRRVEFREST